MTNPTKEKPIYKGLLDPNKRSKSRDLADNKSDLTFENLDKLAKQATAAINKNYYNLGSLDLKDIYQTAWTGILVAISKPKIVDYQNQKGYIYSFAYGYCTHSLHRKSRMVKVPWSVLKDGQEGYAHYSLDNEQTPTSSYSVEDVDIADLDFKEMRLDPNVSELLSKLSDREIQNFLAEGLASVNVQNLQTLLLGKFSSSL